mmetsp:Transcript_105869/g.304226  ORF Transcript_105869/g.304226 Transcript_105869/m.304226 type:complete len:80 (+) Transcript_105869:217-456(+)
MRSSHSNHTRRANLLRIRSGCSTNTSSCCPLMMAELRKLRGNEGCQALCLAIVKIVRWFWAHINIKRALLSISRWRCRW